ncbi:hypothetical protein WMY93_020744 [Mugilogobius chulae]|uniref:Uncharacterized protein n=1 Tax=Mugilogobius chulae TaxID=88201 RepID=A0AAW0NJW0_9GOBI
MSGHPEQNERTEVYVHTEKTQKCGQCGLLSMEQGAKVEDITTVRATYVQPKDPGVRLKGSRLELLEKHLTETIREKLELQLKPAPCEPEYCSVTQESFTIQGFVPLRERVTPVHDYRSEESITFWSKNLQHIQGVTPVRSLVAPFRKCSEFSRPISERLDEPSPPPED